MNKKTIIIAEAGVNHNGDFDMAKDMIYAAKKAGADYVKFQTAIPELVISTFAPKAEYQKDTTGSEESQLEMCRRIHLPLSAYSELAQICREVGIGFMSTPFDLPSIDCLAELDMDFWKIPSGEITNLPYLRKIGAQKGKVIMSTGMSTLAEVEEAVKVLNQCGTPSENIWLLHCTTQYPAPPRSVNLLAMNELRLPNIAGVGYSDHTEGIEIAIAAAAVGAEIVEKHFTLDRNLPGPDHKASLEPDQLAAMVQAIRKVDTAMGDGHKRAAMDEIANIDIARKSIVAAREIKAGEVFTEQNITTKRPGNGINPMYWDAVIGCRAERDFAQDELISVKKLENLP